MSTLNLTQILSGNYRVTFPGLGIEDGLEISRVAFRLGSIEIYWYGLLIASAVLLAMFMSVRHAPKFNLKPDDVLDYFLWTIPAGIVGARLYYVAFAWDEFSSNLWSIFDTRNGGLAFYGGVIAGAVTIFVIGRLKKIKFARMAHFLVPYVALGQAIGRWGNFFNQEAFGTNTTLPWGMYSNGTRNYLAALNNPALDPNLPVHPTFFYEFLGNLIIYFFLINVRKKTKEAYEPLAWYLVLYGTLRFFVENIRTDSLYIGDTDIRVSALLSALMVIAGVAYLIYTRFSSNRLVRRAEMAALLTATPENTDTETVAANVAGTDEVDHYESEAEAEAETVDVEADVNEALPVNEDNEDADMDRLIREAREAATRALAKDQADDESTPGTDPEAGSEKRS